MRIHHVSIRVREGEVCLADDQGRAGYLARLGHQLARTDWRLLSYAVRPAGLYLSLLGGTAPLQSVIYPLHGELGESLEHVVGTTLAFASHAISFDHNEPVRARRATTAWDSPWTSHRAYLGLAPRPDWLCATRGLALCGLPDTAEGRCRFDDMTYRRSLIAHEHWLSPEHVGAVVRARYRLRRHGAAEPAPVHGGDTRPEPASGLAIPTAIARERVRCLCRRPGVGGAP